MAMVLALSVMSVGVAEAESDRPFGHARVLARVPTPPGFPEGIAVYGDLVYASGPATFGSAGKGPSRVLLYHRDTGILLYHRDTGILLRSFATKGEDLSQEHANSSLAVDRFARAYVLNTQLGIYRLSLNGHQERYSTPFPDLRPCSQVAPGTPCSPTPFDAPALPNDIVFDEAGNAYFPAGSPSASRAGSTLPSPPPSPSGVSILAPNGTEVRRLANKSNPIFPYDSPANIAFIDEGAILVTNHAFVTGVTNPKQFTVLDVWVNDEGDPLELPIIF